MRLETVDNQNESVSEIFLGNAFDFFLFVLPLQSFWIEGSRVQSKGVPAPFEGVGLRDSGLIFEIRV